MQHDPRNFITIGRANLFSPISSVTQDGMADRLEMGPYLVCASCVGTQEHVGSDRTECFFDLILRDGGLRLKRSHGSPFGVLSIRTDRVVDPTFLLRRDTPYQGFIISGN